MTQPALFNLTPEGVRWQQGVETEKELTADRLLSHQKPNHVKVRRLRQSHDHSLLDANECQDRM